MKKKLRTNAVTLGVCYYPEHWKEERWESDFRRMRESGISVIRIGEFAWAIFEPAEGEFDFRLFDRALDAAHRHGLQVVFGTPTAAPPAWLTGKYPEALNATLEGVLYRHGLRRHCGYNSPVYRRLCERIVRKLGERYGSHPAVIGWQIDNEFNCELDVFYADADHAAFREWTKKKYGTLEQLNEAWGTVVWSQTYTSWEQVHLPRPTAHGSINPHLALDEKRFISDSVRSFAKLQADILRELAPGRWVTTNGMFGHLDSHELTDTMLDFYSYDSYPLFAAMFPDRGERPLLDRKWSLNLSAVRSVSPLFCVMEQQAGPGGWADRFRLPSPKPGQCRLWTYQSILHGADLLLYFRWRTAPAGTEIYWHGIYDWDDRENRRSEEVRRVGLELARAGAELAGAEYAAEAAIVRSCDNEWDAERDAWLGPLARQSESAWFKAFQYRHIPSDVLYIRDGTSIEDLTRYKTLICPHAAILTEETATLLEAYVRGGGTLVLGCRSGFKERTGRMREMPAPGPLAALCGIDVADFTAIMDGGEAPGIRFVDESGMGSERFQAELFHEILNVRDDDTETIARYDGDYYAGLPAMTRRRAGEGEVWYFGAAFSDGVVDALLDRLPVGTPVDWIDLPPQVELGIREKDGKRFVFLLNYGGEPVSIHVRREARELLSGRSVSAPFELEGYGAAVLEAR